jgi:hypothetical protein
MEDARTIVPNRRQLKQVVKQLVTAHASHLDACRVNMSADRRRAQTADDPCTTMCINEAFTKLLRSSAICSIYARLLKQSAAHAVERVEVRVSNGHFAKTDQPQR